MVAARRMREHVLARQQRIPEYPVPIHLRLVDEVGRGRIATFAAAGQYFGVNSRAEVDRRDEAVAGYAVDPAVFLGLIRREGGQRAPFG